MIENNQFNIKPGPFRHINNGKIYILKTLSTHVQIDGIWCELPEPECCYEDLEKEFEDFKDSEGRIIRKMVHRGYKRSLSEFKEKFIQV